MPSPSQTQHTTTSLPPEKAPLLQPQSHNNPPTILQKALSSPLTWTGGPYAILLQFASPPIALGSLSHSRFASDGLSRLRRTAAYLLAITHGTALQKSTIRGLVNKQHSFVKGGIYGYDARDGGLQKWTAATLLMGILVVDGVFYGDANGDGDGIREGWRTGWGWIPSGRRRMTRAEKEELCLQAGVFGSSLDMPKEMWFSSLEEFEGYFDQMINKELEISDAAREISRVFLYEMKLPFWLAWLMPVVRVFMTFWLPPRWREAYGLADPEGGGLWMVVMSGWYVVLVWGGWLVDLLMPGWVKGWLFGVVKRDMEWAVEEILRTGRWPM